MRQIKDQAACIVQNPSSLSGKNDFVESRSDSPFVGKKDLSRSSWPSLTTRLNRKPASRVPHIIIAESSRIARLLIFL